MLTFLRKTFIKDYTNINDHRVRKAHGIMATIGGIFINLFLFASKLVIGLITMSLALVTDALNNLSDLFSSIVNLLGFFIASKPADREHPYGHQKVENIAGLIVSFFIVTLAILLGYNAITSLIKAEPTYIDFSLYNWLLIILGTSILLKVVLAFFYKAIHKTINSVSIKALFVDSLSDVVTTSAVAIALVVQKNFPNLWWLDYVLTLIIVLFIMYSGVKLVIETSSPLIGLTPDEKLMNNICKDIKAFEGVLGVHDLQGHIYGPGKIFVTIHVEVDGYQNMFKAHELIDDIEHTISKKYNIELTIHMDPVDVKSEELLIIGQTITNLTIEADKNITFHDLRITKKDNIKYVFFDLVIPENLNNDQLIIKQKLIDGINSINKKYVVKIRIDTKFS